MSFTRNLPDTYGKQLLDTATKTGIDALKTVSKKSVSRAAAATGEFIGNKITYKIGKPKPVPDENSRNVGEIVIPPKEREEIFNELRQVL